MIPAPAATVPGGGLLHEAGLEAAGKALVALLFWWSGVSGFILDWHGTVGMVSAHYLPLPALTAALAATIELAAPLALFHRRAEPWAALVLAAYCLLTALLFHNFWALAGAAQTMQKAHFFKNLALAGALTALAGRPAAAPRQ